jgi:ferredoxin
MSKKKVVLNFPPHLIDQPITYRLIREHELVVNILRARITPREWGRMVVELEGTNGKLEAALSFLADLGVGVDPLAGEVNRQEERCIHCTACIASCPTEALRVDRSSMEVSFDQELCIACELCLNTCSYGAMAMSLE